MELDDRSVRGDAVRGAFPTSDQLAAALHDLRTALRLACADGTATLTSELCSADQQAQVLLKRYVRG